MAANYVKFKRGTPEAFAALKLRGVEEDTLYFIFKEEENTADLYLGSRLISSGDFGDGNLSNIQLKDLSDITVENLETGEILVYNGETKKWENQSVDLVLESYHPTAPSVALIVNNIHNEHSTLIEEEYAEKEEKAGDIIIIKDPIAGDKYQHTGYVYDGSNWVALDGNYKADNIYFNNNLVFTTAFGRYEPTSSGNVTIPAKGMNLQQLLEDAYSVEDAQDLIVEEPTAAISGNLKYYEIGSTGTQDIIVSLNSDGAYKYGYSTDSAANEDGAVVTNIKNDGTTGVHVNTQIENPFVLKVDSVEVSPKEVGGAVFTVAPAIRFEKSELVAQGEVYHSAGHAPVSNLGKAYPSQAIAAGSKLTTSTARARWYIPMYQGFTYSESAIQDPSSITADELVTLTAPIASTVGSVNKVTGDKAYNETKITTATASKSWRQYFLAIPASYGWEMKNAKDSNNIDCTIRKANDVTLTFGSDLNTTDILYNVYYINNAADYGTLKINWTM